MRSRPALLVLAWIGLTLGLTLVAWFAVRVVADQVGGSGSTVLTEAQVDGLLLQAATPAPSTSGASPRPSTSPKPSASKTATPRSTPSGTPKPSRTSDPGSPPSAKSFAVAGGVVAVTCRGSSISLDSARPADGWTVEVKDRGPERVEVRFENDNDRSEVRVECQQGKPVRDGGNSGPG